MSLYRKIDTRTFGDSKFRRLRRSQPCGQYLWLWLLTGPGTCQIPGVIFNMGAHGMAELLGWDKKGFREAFEEILSLGMVKADFEAPLVFIPNAIKYNRPQSPNVITAWSRAWENVPECPLKEHIRQLLEASIEGMSRGFQEAFAEACPKSKENQEQLAGTENRKQEQNIASEKVSLFMPHTRTNRSQQEHQQPISEWMPLEEWNGFLQMRKAKRAELKGRAMNLILMKLSELRATGQDISAVLDQSTANGWKNVFPVKKGTVGVHSKNVELKEIDHTVGTYKRTDGSLAF